MAKNKISGYLRQRERGRSDRAYCRIDGKKIKLGIYGSAVSKRKYADLLAADDDQMRATARTEETTLTDLMLAYWEHAEAYYGFKTQEWYHNRIMVSDLKERYANTPAADFRAKRLQEIRNVWIGKGWSRYYVNKTVTRLKRMFKWGVAQELVPAETFHSLCAVDGLRAGKTTAPDKPPIKPVSNQDVEATLPYLPEMIACMVRVQKLTAMRPGEVCRLRKRDIDRSGEIWIARLKEHKGAWRGRGDREIFIGPQCQALLLPRLVCGDDDRIFPILRSSYRRAVARSCMKAGIETWFPNQLRHAAGTTARKLAGLEGAQLLLGHAHAKTSEIYAETNRERALELALRIG